MTSTQETRIEEFEKNYGRLPKAYRRKLMAILGRDTAERRRSGLDLQR